MFGFSKNAKIKKLEKKYAHLMQQALEAQRNGKLELYGELSKESEELAREIDKLKSKSSD